MRPAQVCLGLMLLLALGGIARGVEIRSAIYVMRPDGTELRKVVQIPEYKEHNSPRWSHDGKRIAFDASHAITRANKLFIVNADGSELKEVGAGSMPDWSPDDKQLAFQHVGGGNLTAGVCVQNLDGNGRTWISGADCPRWSPDGSKIVCTDGVSLRVLDLVAGTQQDVLDEPFDRILVGFDWSPDGKQLAFVGERGGKRELVIVNAAGSGQGIKVRLVSKVDGHVGWSPGGERLVCAMSRQLYLLDVEGTGTKIIPAQRGPGNDGAWSPDGKWLALAGNRGE